MVEIFTSMPGDGLEDYPSHGDSFTVTMTENAPVRYTFTCLFGLQSNATYPEFQNDEVNMFELGYIADGSYNVFIAGARGSSSFSNTEFEDSEMSILGLYHTDQYGYDPSSTPYTYENWEDVFLRFTMEWVDAENGDDGIMMNYEILDYVQGDPAVIEPTVLPGGVELATSVYQDNSGFGWYVDDGMDIEPPFTSEIQIDVAILEEGGAVYTDSPLGDSDGGTDPIEPT